MSIVYIQCDARYNEFLLKTIEGREVIGRTIDKVRKICDFPIISSIVDCEQNKELVDYLRNKCGISVALSSQEDVNKRFLDAVMDTSDYVIRVAGDQLLLSENYSKIILDQMIEGGYEFFYEETINNSILPDIILADSLRNNKSKLYEADRYFTNLLKDNNIRRLKITMPSVFLNCRANDYLGYIFSKQIIENNLDIFDLTSNLVRHLNSKHCDVYTSGILTSWMLGGSSVEFFYDLNAEIRPWWCEAAANLVRQRICNLKGLNVFEWGSGNSTLFWERYADKVISIEHDKSWCEKMKLQISKQTEIKYYELEYGKDYCNAICNEEGTFDIILIDGRDRVRCAKNCICKLSKNGVVIWDDTERNYYDEGIMFLKEKGFKQLELTGIMPGGLAKQYTSIFYRDNNILEL